MIIFLNISENIDNTLQLLNNIDYIYILSSNNNFNHTFYNKINKSNIIYTQLYNFKNISELDINNSSICYNDEQLLNYKNIEQTKLNSSVLIKNNIHKEKSNMFIPYKCIIHEDNTVENISNINIELLKLLDNIYINDFSDIIISKYKYNLKNKFYNNNTKKILYNLLDNIKNTIIHIKEHLKLISMDILYIDVINKNIKQYFEKNKYNIINNLLINIETFYILSIIFNNNNANIYILHYNTILLNNIKKYVKI